MNKNSIKFLLVPFVIFLVSCQKTNNDKPSESTSKEELLEIKNLTAIETSHFTSEQVYYLSNNDPSNTSPYCGNMSVSAPKPIHLSWEGNYETYTVVIGKDENLTNVIGRYDVNEQKEFDFYNGEIHRDYYWSVVGHKGEKEGTSSIQKFDTKAISVRGPRNLNIEGVENFRDIGGWGNYTESFDYATYIKQGMIYRSGRFNKDKQETPVVTITESGLSEVKNHLKIKTEIDLRRTSTNEVGGLTDKSVLGDDVNYIQLPMYYGGNNILTFKGKAPSDTYEYDNPAAIKNFFEILADENNYPIDFHCSIGKDRTGCLAYLVEALLGFDQEALYRDYMFTNFADAGMCKLEDDILKRYGKTLDDYEGTDIQNKTYNYLHQEIGLSEETLNSVISILEA